MMSAWKLHIHRLLKLVTGLEDRNELILKSYGWSGSRAVCQMQYLHKRVYNTQDNGAEQTRIQQCSLLDYYRVSCRTTACCTQRDNRLGIPQSACYMSHYVLFKIRV